MEAYDLKKQIILKLEELDNVRDKFMKPEELKPLSKDYVTGFIFGSETIVGLRLTPDMVEEIVKRFT